MLDYASHYSSSYLILILFILLPHFSIINASTTTLQKNLRPMQRSPSENYIWASSTTRTIYQSYGLIVTLPFRQVIFNTNHITILSLSLSLSLSLKTQAFFSASKIDTLRINDPLLVLILRSRKPLSQESGGGTAMISIILPSLIGISWAWKSDKKSQRSVLNLLSSCLISLGARQVCNDDPRTIASFTNLLLYFYKTTLEPRIRDKIDQVHHHQFKIWNNDPG